MSNAEIITAFYIAFSRGDAAAMTAYYHPEVIFRDPVFGELRGERARRMWEMLLSRRTDTTTITFGNVRPTAQGGTAEWTAEYPFGKAKRRVVNQITTDIRIRGGKITEHTDTFDLWRWSRQAIGPAGYLLGWTDYLQQKIRTTATERLDTYCKNNS